MEIKQTMIDRLQSQGNFEDRILHVLSIYRFHRPAKIESSLFTKTDPRHTEIKRGTRKPARVGINKKNVI